jgi:hypothetical protein
MPRYAAVTLVTLSHKVSLRIGYLLGTTVAAPLCRLPDMAGARYTIVQYSDAASPRPPGLLSQ